MEMGSNKEINILVHNAANGDDQYLPNITEDFYQMQNALNAKGTRWKYLLLLPE